MLASPHNRTISTTRISRANRFVAFSCALILFGSFSLGLLAQPPKSIAFETKAPATAVSDFSPIAQEASAELTVLNELAVHAHAIPTNLLNQKGIEVPVADLLRKNPADPKVLAKPELRYQLLKYTARLSRVVRHVVSEDLRKAGVSELYEAWVLPGDRSDPVLLLVTELPRGIVPKAQFTPAPRVLVSGYFLKVHQYRAADAEEKDPSGNRFAPVLVGHSFDVISDPNPEALLPAVPLDQFREVAPEPNLIPESPKLSKFQFDGDLAIYSSIRDFVSLRDGDRFAEGIAYDDLVRHVRKYDPDELVQAAEEFSVTELLRRKSVSIPSVEPGKPPENRLQMIREDYRFKLLKITGQLKKISRVPVVSPELTAAGVTDLYEAWLITPERGEPLCVVLTELPFGLKPTPEVRPSLTVTMAGYFFKVIRYESNEPAKNNDPVIRFAPLFVAKTLVKAEKPDVDGGKNWRTVFLPALLTGLGLLTAVFLGLTWWFRATDRSSKKAIEQNRQNPFAEQSPPTEPSG